MPSPLRAERGGDHPVGLDDDNADDTAEHTPTEGEPPAKRVRGTALGAAKNGIAGHALKVNDLQLVIDQVSTMNDSSSTKKRLAKEKAKMVVLMKKIQEQQSKVNTLYENAVAKQKEKEDKAAKKDKQEETNRKLSDQGCIELVALRTGKYERRFANTSGRHGRLDLAARRRRLQQAVRRRPPRGHGQVAQRRRPQEALRVRAVLLPSLVQHRQPRHARERPRG